MYSLFEIKKELLIIENSGQLFKKKKTEKNKTKEEEKKQKQKQNMHIQPVRRLSKQLYCIHLHIFHVWHWAVKYSQVINRY